MFLFPFTAPIVRPLAAKLPDAGFRRILGARKTIRDVALRLIAKHRRFLEQVLPCGPYGVVWTSWEYGLADHHADHHAAADAAAEEASEVNWRPYECFSNAECQ